MISQDTAQRLLEVSKKYAEIDQHSSSCNDCWLGKSCGVRAVLMRIARNLRDYAIEEADVDNSTVPTSLQA